MFTASVVAVISMATSIELQVICHRKHAQVLLIDLPASNIEPYATLPRKKYPLIPKSLAFPAFLGAFAGVLYRRSSFFTITSVLLLTSFPTVVAYLDYQE